MTAPRTTKSRRCSPASTDGMTIIELLIAILITTIVLGSALALTLSSRKLYDTDSSRIEINQNLRGILEIIGSDVRVAGERLNSFGSSGQISHPLAAVEVRNGNELILRRNMINEILPLCQNIGGSGSSILISTTDLSVYGAVPQCNAAKPGVASGRAAAPAGLRERRPVRAA